MPVPTAARFSDGRTALVRDVRIDPTPDALRILDETGAELVAWPYAGLYLAEEVYGEQPVRLMHKDAGAACLTLHDKAALQALRALSPGLRRHVGRSRRRWTARGIAMSAVGVALLAAVAVWGLPQLANALLPWVPASWYRTLGDQFVAAVEQTYPACAAPSDAAGQLAIESLVRRLMRAVPTTGSNAPEAFSVSVLDSPVPNAFAAPGARILVFRGILKVARTPEELAGVLAHEAGHALARHPERGVLRALGWRWLIGGLFGSASIAPESLQTLLILAYTRDDERAADRRAVTLLEQQGLRSDGLPKFLERLAADPKLNGQGVPGFLASHPSPEARARELRALVNPALRGAPWTRQEWKAIQGLCKRPKTVKEKQTMAQLGSELR